jgi:protein-L-isoaspartate(D-aspartate) O-methyltransferase
MCISKPTGTIGERAMVGLIALALMVLGALGFACASSGGGNGAQRSAGEATDVDTARRQRMVDSQIRARGITDAAVLDAMRTVPRHRFVPDSLHPYAYSDGPLRIGHGQTISQPYIVALMTSLIEPKPSMKVLEIGTGSGYQAAILAECVGDVYTIEIVPELGKSATRLLGDLGYENIHTRIGDGFDGWPEHAPFDGVVVTAAPEKIPQPLLDQLAVGGRLVIPVGRGSQDLVLVTRTKDGYDRQSVTPVRFVPMTGKAQD